MKAAFNQKDIAGLQKSFLNRELGAVDNVRYGLDRISRFDSSGPSLAAILELNSAALDLAAQQDTLLEQHGKLCGPLHGVSIVLKDNIGTTGMSNTAGSESLQDLIPTSDSTLAHKLKSAGALIIGKANMHEFAAGGTSVSSRGGQVLNPYDLSRTPGGSSGGSAVAVAMGYCNIAMATDTVNSIRSPASATGLIGFRPSRGLVSRAGVIPVSVSQDAVGPIARNVTDIARIMDVIAGYDPADPITAYSINNMPNSYLDNLDKNALAGRKLGLIKTFMGTQPHNLEVNKAVWAAVDVMRKAGADVIEINDECLDSDTILRDYDVQLWEFKQALEAYLHSQEKAPLHSLQEILNSGKYHQASLHDYLLKSQFIGSINQQIEYQGRLYKHQQLKNHLYKLMADNDLDAFIYPLQKQLVVPISNLQQSERNGLLAAVTGFAALNIPMGFSEPNQHAPLGVPMGMDIMVRPFDDSLALAFGYAYEQHSNIWRAPEFY